MANYTIELREIIEGGHNIFDFKYPFYNEEKRKAFEKNFIRHFYFREIGAETIDRFKLYLEDKMNNVFPYYNKLLETTMIEYEIIDNYKLTETYERTVDNEGKTSAISSSVGRLYGEQESNTNQTHNTESNGTTKETDTTKNNETVKSTGSKETEDNGSATDQKINKFLDTPQGKIDLTDSNYLTELRQENSTGTQQNKGKETSSNTQQTDGTTTRTNEGNQTGKETGTNNTNLKATNEEHNTSDNNTRAYSNNKQTEKYVITRKGNIGVDTDSDVINKHLKLQKLLTTIERNFFDECEDLFMLVY